MPDLSSLVKKLNLEPLANPTYRTLRRIPYKLAGETYTVEVENARGRFLIPTYKEWVDLHSLEERPILTDLISNLRQDDIFYDIGANIGLYSCLVADVVAGPVFAFEPHPGNADRLEKNIELNGANISILRYAIANSVGKAELNVTLKEIGSAGHSLVSDPSDSLDKISVEKKQGDDLIAEENLPQPTVLKIDVEGAESAVLEGMESTLSRTDCRLVYCETHANRLEMQGSSISAVHDKLKGHGFSVSKHTIRNGKGESFLIGKK